jgi:glutaminyl-tRNA synthetase
MHDDTGQSDFVRECVKDDNRTGRFGGRVVTRFPPEPNGYLHIGHAKSICLNFGIAAEFGGRCHLRFDDTNPETEEVEYVESILDDVRWLGFDWGEHLYYASDYFERMYACAEDLIRAGGAYVCTLTPEEFKAYRGVPTRPGKASPWRDRPPEESLDLFRRMRAGEFADGAYVLRARIDMASPNLHLRDPVLYRIKHAAHHRTGDTWCLYPSYDFAHGLEDSFEGVTHSICTLEFEVHRPLYDWLLDAMQVYRPRQIEFARLNLTYTLMSKRKLLQLVREGRVTGWDDPRMPTLRGLRRRGYTPSAIRAFCRRLGVTKTESVTDLALLEHCIRDELNRTAPRTMAVLDPVKLVIDNYPADTVEEIEAVNNPEDPAAGTRRVPFSRELYIEAEDFMEDPPRKFFRLALGREVRLRYAYFVTCTGVVKDPETRAVREIHCTYDPATRGGDAPDGRKVKATLHWVSAARAVEAEVRLYDRLFRVERPDAAEDGLDFREHLNPDALRCVRARLEPALAALPPGTRVQFERKGYFVVDTEDARPDAPVFNRIVTLKDTWAKHRATAS